MLLGSMLAGMAFADFLWLQFMLWPIHLGSFHITHGLSNALILPSDYLRFNAVDAWATKKYAELFPFLFPNEEMGNNNQTNASLFIEKLTVLSKELGLPQKLREVSIPEDVGQWQKML